MKGRKLIFMNHKIRDPKNLDPVIVVQDARGRQKEYHRVEIKGPSTVMHLPKGTAPDGFPCITTHVVHVWIETDADVEGAK